MIPKDFNFKKVNAEISILLVDDEKNLLTALETTLLSSGIEKISLLSNASKIMETMEALKPNILVLDENIASIRGSELIGPILYKFPSTQIIMLTAIGDIELVVKCMQSGAIDFLTKPIDEARLLAAIYNALKKITMVDELQKMKSYLTGKNLEHPEYFSKIISTNDKITNLFKYIESVAKTPLPILLTGETGVGKELFAQAIHKTSQSSGNFVAFNAAGTDDNFFSDTLFGHVDGAFTSAEKKRIGLLSEAENGTIFIDEIGDLPLNSQIKLLRLLQEKEYYPIGADKPKQCNAKIVCATNKSLAEEVKSGRFRADLFYRLNSHVIYIPPLRERIQDIEVLIPHFINKHKTNKNFTIGYPKQLLPILSQYSFPGNIRELEMMVADALATCKGSTIPLEPFFNKIDAVKSIKDKTFSNEYSTIDDFPSLHDIEKQHIQKALALAEQNQSLASRLLGITRQTLHNKLKDQ